MGNASRMQGADSLIMNEAKSDAEKVLRAHGFRKGVNGAWLRNTEEEVHQAAIVSVSRFAPIVFVDLGVLIRERWVDRLQTRAVGGPGSWDLTGRIEDLIAPTAELEALNMAVEMEPGARKNRIAALFKAAESTFFDRFKNVEDVRAYATQYARKQRPYVNGFTFEYFGLPIPEPGKPEPIIGIQRVMIRPELRKIRPTSKKEGHD